MRRKKEKKIWYRDGLREEDYIFEEDMEEEGDENEIVIKMEVWIEIGEKKRS